MQNDKIHKRGRYTAEFKEKVALEALTGARTHAQIASEYGISPDLVKDWKKQAKEMLGECFRRDRRKTEMEKKDENKEEKKEGRYLRKEFSYTKFHQTLLLPDNAEKDEIDACVKDGVLYVTVPKVSKEKTEEKKKEIEVK